MEPSNPIKADFTYRPTEVKKESLGAKIMGPLRRAIGSSVGKDLGKIRLSKSEKTALKDSKAQFISDGSGKTITIAMQNKKGHETHQLDGILVNNPNENPEKEKKYILVFYGMGDCYEKHLESMKKLAEDTGATVVSFNYRGKGDSTGSADSVKDYIMDGKAFMEHLKQNEGAQPENILLYGHSLGGGVAAKVCEETGHKGSIVLDSSFSTFKKASKHKKGAFTAWIIKKSGWAINNVKALANVEEGKLGIIVNRRDPTVHYEKASFYKGLKNKGAEGEVEVVKIGTKPLREQLDQPAVKSVKKSFKKKESENEPVAKENNPDYKDLQGKIKKAGWMPFLRHPHQMIIDQPKQPDDISMPDKIKAELNQLKLEAGDNEELKAAYSEKEALAGELLELNKKYANEDQLAYDGMVDMIKVLFNSGNKLPQTRESSEEI